MSPYNYVFNNPISFIDPDGREPIPALWPIPVGVAVWEFLFGAAVATTATVIVVNNADDLKIPANITTTSLQYEALGFAQECYNACTAGESTETFSADQLGAFSETFTGDIAGAFLLMAGEGFLNDLTVEEFMGNNSERINSKIGKKLGKSRDLPFEASREGFAAALSAIEATLINPSVVSDVFTNRIGDEVIDIFSGETGMTVRVRTDGTFDTLIPEATESVKNR